MSNKSKLIESIINVHENYLWWLDEEIVADVLRYHKHAGCLASRCSRQMSEIIFDLSDFIQNTLF